MRKLTAYHPLSRREFIKLASAAAGAIALGGCGLRPTDQHGEATPGPVAASPTATPTTDAAPSLEFLPSATGSDFYALPAPQIGAGLPLMEALARRKSTRDYSRDEIPVQVLSDLLWAGFGVNRPGSGQRTAPSAHNVQDITIYVATAGGLFRYDAKAHSLIPVLPDDLRPATTVQGQANVAEAPVQLIYVSDYLRMSSSEEEKRQWSWAHTGLIAQNVYLYCASAGMASVVRSSFDRRGLEERMGLESTEHVTLIQAVGYPKA